MSQLVDSHCHLDFPQFATDIAEVVRRAGEAQVMRMVTVCTKPARVGESRAIAERFDPVCFAVGVHPHYAASEPAVTVEELVGHAEHPKMVAIGESGLDYHYTSKTAGAQKSSLLVHIEASRRTGLPLIIHSRDADDDMCDILASEHRAGPFSCVMHCFSSGRRLAGLAIDLGFYISMSGIVTFRNAEGLRSIFLSLPVERILVETDSPYLAPAPKRGKRNEPALVARIASECARLRGLDEGEFAVRTTENFNRLFAKGRLLAPNA